MLVKDLLKKLRIVLTGYTLIILVPIIDLIISKGKGSNIAYLFPERDGNFFIRLLTFFGDFSEKGVTFGQRFLIAFGIIAGFIYFYIKTKRINKSIIADEV